VKRVKGSAGAVRALFNRIPRRPGTITTQSYLRLEKQLTTQSAVTFDVLNNQGAQTVTEKRLAITDAFQISALSIFFYTHNSTVANSQEKSRLHSWNNPSVFAGAGEAASLQGFYNGYLSIRVNSTVFLDSLDIYRFYRAGVAQQGLEQTVTPTVGTYQADSWDGGDYGFYSMTPSIELSGATKNEISISLPSNLTVTPAANHRTFVVCYLRGFLQQNAAQFNSKVGYR
jgi:hypothetical protein